MWHIESKSACSPHCGKGSVDFRLNRVFYQNWGFLLQIPALVLQVYQAGAKQPDGYTGRAPSAL